eukprot:1148367-Pelagomonas_calceolata.AAC.5
MPVVLRPSTWLTSTGVIESSSAGRPLTLAHKRLMPPSLEQNCSDTVSCTVCKASVSATPVPSSSKGVRTRLLQKSPITRTEWQKEAKNHKCIK